MVEHAETFMCLYSTEMDAALEVQPPDSWDSFPLFQLLNDFLRMDCECMAIQKSIFRCQYGPWRFFQFEVQIVYLVDCTYLLCDSVFKSF